MTTQPKALRLAELFAQFNSAITMASAELRRLHEVNTELLAALKAVYETCDWHGDDGRAAMWDAHVAINKAERTTP
jgi:hypothetical protein